MEAIYRLLRRNWTQNLTEEDLNTFRRYVGRTKTEQKCGNLTEWGTVNISWLEKMLPSTTSAIFGWPG